MNSDPQETPGGQFNHAEDDEISLRPYFEALWAYRKAIAAGLVATVVFFVAGLLTSVLLSRTERVGSIEFRLLFEGADKGEYPDESEFSPSEIVAAPVLTEVYRINGLERFGRYETFKDSMFVLQSDPELDLLTYEYQARLSDTKLTPADRARIEGEFRSKLAAIKDPGYALSMRRSERLRTLPRGLMEKVLQDTLAVWARQAAERKGATGFDIPLLSRNVFKEEMLSEESYLVAIDMLRVKARRLRLTIHEMEKLPGAKILRAGSRNVSLPEVGLTLNDIERFVLQGLIRSDEGTEEGRTLTRYANSQFFQVSLERDATAARIESLRQALREYVSPLQADTTTGRGTAEGGRTSSGPQAAAAPFGESFLDRLVEMSTHAQTSDVAYRQKLTDQVIEERDRLSILDREVAYYEQMGKGIQGTTGPSVASTETVAFVKARLRTAFDALTQASDDVMAIYAEMQRYTLNPSTLLYAITGPFVVREQPPLYPRTVLMYFVLVMLAALVLIPAGCLIHHAFRNSGLASA